MMTPEQIEEFKDLWDGSNPDMVLVIAPHFHHGFYAYDLRGAIVLIETDSIVSEVYQRMREAGVRVVTEEERKILSKGKSLYE